MRTSVRLSVLSLLGFVIGVIPGAGSPDSIPIPLIVLGSIAALLMAAGAAGAVPRSAPTPVVTATCTASSAAASRPASWPRRDAASVDTATSGQTLTGLPGCPGQATGRARVILDPSDPTRGTRSPRGRRARMDMRALKTLAPGWPPWPVRARKASTRSL